MGRLARWAGIGVIGMIGGGVAIAASPAAAAFGCGSVVVGHVVLQSDITGCTGDGLIVGAANTRINLNVHAIGGTRAPGSVGIRVSGHNDVRIESTAPFAAIQEFEVGIGASATRRLSVSGVATQVVVVGLSLERSRGATVRGNNLGFAERVPSCDPATAPAGIKLVDSDRNTIRDNAAQLTGYGILLVRSDDNTVRGNGAAPEGSDGNVCDGIALINADRNVLTGNTATENRSGNPLGGDGIFVDAASAGTTVRGNHAVTNTDDGIDVDNATTKIVGNTADRNDDLGIESVPGVAASGNRASGNGNPLQCLNIACT